jgi:hypothetical protein
MNAQCYSGRRLPSTRFTFAMSFANRIRPAVDHELAAATQASERAAQFRHLERAHVLGQASTREHVRVHWRMFTWALRERDAHEAAGQLMRIVGAATKTAIGFVPHGNTGGANVSPFRRMPIAVDLAEQIARARN